MSKVARPERKQNGRRNECRRGASRRGKTAGVLRDEAKENRTREILELMRNSKTLEEAVEKVKALLNK